MKYFFLKIKDVGLSLLPILLVVLVLHFGFADFDSSLMWKFVLSIVIIVIGEVLFLSGVDGSIMPMGDFVGNSVNKFSKLAVVLFFAFIFGLCATIAEPDLNVLATQVQNSQLINIPKFLFVFVVGASVGALIAFSLFRILKNINYKIVMFVIFLVAFILAVFVPENLMAIAFDAGGATTGIITSPFLLALASGIASKKSSSSHSDNFGVIGIASSGPILAILFLSLLTAGNGANVVETAESLNIFISVLVDTAVGLIPLVAVFFIFDALFLKISKKKKKNLIFGIIVTFFGLYLFLFGIDYGMLEMGSAVGKFLTTRSPTFSIILSVIIGFLITFTEPSVRVLGSQVEEITNGNIRKGFVTIAIAVAMMLAVSLSTVKIIFDISIWYILGVGYGLILLLMPFSNTTFVSIAFDSGGVASGPMSAAFILPLMLGFASSKGGAVEGFGLIAIVGMMPILVIEIIGVVYKIKLYDISAKEYKKNLRIAYGMDMYSNIDSLEEAYNRRKALKEMEEEREKNIAEEIMIAQQLEVIKAIKEENDGEITS
ncbi:MAG: DUF1538 domain-containing protein [Clostridia bacterium]|nr:DUF1538 domain-containing protein [Clostridia bacterium]